MEKKRRILEVCVDSVESGVEAARAGADRLELCSNLIIGGTTPTPALFTLLRERVHIPIRVLLRPRFGDFCYTEWEKRTLLAEAEQFGSLGAEGIVIGALLPEGRLDRQYMRSMKEAAGGMRVTLHRAFDMTKSWREALEEAVELGVDTILTSGQSESAWEGRECLAGIVEAAGDRIEIMAGAGVGSQILRQLCRETGVTACHMSGKRILESPMQYRNPRVHMGLPGISEYRIWRSDGEEIERAASILKALEQKA